MTVRQNPSGGCASSRETRPSHVWGHSGIRWAVASLSRELADALEQTDRRTDEGRHWVSPPHNYAQPGREHGTTLPSLCQLLPPPCRTAPHIPPPSPSSLRFCQRFTSPALLLRLAFLSKFMLREVCPDSYLLYGMCPKHFEMSVQIVFYWMTRAIPVFKKSCLVNHHILV